MIIDPSLAKGLSKGERRRLNKAIETIGSVSHKGTRAAWLRNVEKELKRVFGDYIVFRAVQGTKPANTMISYLVIIRTKNDNYIAFNIIIIAVWGRKKDVKVIEEPIAITHHAFERLIQSAQTTNLKELVKILHAPIVYIVAHFDEHGSPKEGDATRFFSPFGVFLFGADSSGVWLLKTVIKADALEGAKRTKWENEMRKLGIIET